LEKMPLQQLLIYPSNLLALGKNSPIARNFTRTGIAWKECRAAPGSARHSRASGPPPATRRRRRRRSRAVHSTTPTMMAAPPMASSPLRRSRLARAQPSTASPSGAARTISEAWTIPLA
jgi:hypothetical protein